MDQGCLTPSPVVFRQQSTLKKKMTMSELLQIGPRNGAMSQSIVLVYDQDKGLVLEPPDLLSRYIENVPWDFQSK